MVAAIAVEVCKGILGAHGNHKIPTNLKKHHMHALIFLCQK